MKISKLAFLALALVLSTQAHAALSSDVAIAVRSAIVGERGAYPATIARLTGDTLADSRNLDNVVAVLKRGGQSGFGIFDAGVAIRRGLHADVNNAPDKVWLSILVDLNAVDNAIVPGTNLKGFNAVEMQFSKVFEDLKAENPLFSVQAIQKYINGPTPAMYHPIFNINNTALESIVLNLDAVTINGTRTWAINIPIAKTDSLDDVLTLIDALTNKFKVVTSLE